MSTCSGELKLGSNPDNILIGDTLKFICPPVLNPPASRPNLRKITNVGPVFEVSVSLALVVTLNKIMFSVGRYVCLMFGPSAEISVAEPDPVFLGHPDPDPGK